MKLVKENDAYKVQLDGVNGIIKMDALVRQKYDYILYIY